MAQAPSADDCCGVMQTPNGDRADEGMTLAAVDK